MLSQKAKYAFQALAYLSAHYKSESPVLIGTIARERAIPIKFLEAILCELKNHEVLVSSRGRSGGYRLSAAPKDITLARVSCVSLNFYKPCDNCNQQTCGINPIMAEARDAILKVLEKRSLKDIMDKECVV